MASPPPPPTVGDHLEITVISAKHLKNVNWRNGDLKPYAVAYLEPDRRAATKPDGSGGSTSPVWNERLTLPIPPSPSSSPPLFLTLDIFHSKPSETPKPLVATARLPLSDLVDLRNPVPAVRTLHLRRPSGRPQGKLRIKIALSPPPPPPPPNYHFAPPYPPYYYPPTFSPPPPPLPHYPFSSSPEPYYSYSAPPQPPSAVRAAYYDHRPPAAAAARYGAGPSAPVGYDYSYGGGSSAAASYEPKPKGGRMGMGAGLAVGALAGSLGGLALGEGMRYREEEEAAEHVENEVGSRGDYSEYRADYSRYA